MRYKDLQEATPWAVDADLDKATQPHQNRMKHGSYDDYTLLWLNIEDVFANTERDFTLDVNDPKGGPNAIGNRLSQAKTHWEQGGHMDPSELGVSDWSKQIVFTNGRHRMVAAFQRGEEYAPALVDNDSVEKIRKLVRVK